MTIVRTNTIFFDFGSVPWPSHLEAHRWLKAQGVNDGDCKTIDLNNYTRELIVKFINAEKFSLFLEGNRECLSFRKDSETFDIYYRTSEENSAAQALKTVRLKAVPGDVENLSDLKKFLEQYGRVIKIYREKLNSVSPELVAGSELERVTAVMQLRKDIPSYVSYEGEKLPVNYLGQPQTCAHCSSLEHLASACPSRRPRRWANAQVDLEPAPQPMGAAVALSSQQAMPSGSDPKARAKEVKTKPHRRVPSDPIPLKNRYNLLNFVPNNEATNDSTQRVPTSKFKPIVSKKNKRGQGSSPDTHKSKKPLMDGNDADADTSDTDSIDDPLFSKNQDVEAEDQELVGTNDSVSPIVPGQPTVTSQDFENQDVEAEDQELVGTNDSLSPNVPGQPTVTSQDLEPSVGTPNLDAPVVPFVGQPRPRGVSGSHRYESLFGKLIDSDDDSLASSGQT